MRCYWCCVVVIGAAFHVIGDVMLLVICSYVIGDVLLVLVMYCCVIGDLLLGHW